MNQQLINKLKVIRDEEEDIKGGRLFAMEGCEGQMLTIDVTKILKDDEDIGILPCTRLIDFSVHKHNYIEIVYVCQGEITHVIENKELTMKPGDLLFMNHCVHHSMKMAKEQDVAINLVVRPRFFDIPLSMLKKDSILADFLVNIIRKDTTIPQYLHFQPHGNQAIENLLENIIESVLREKKQEQELNQLTMGLVFLHLLQHINTLGETSTQDYKSILVDTTLQYVNCRYQDANLTELAVMVHRSLSDLSKLIKKYTGHTFQELLQRKRFHKAIELLVDTALPVADIIKLVGYENSTYFYNKFHEKFQTSPREYRIRYKNKDM